MFRSISDHWKFRPYGLHISTTNYITHSLPSFMFHWRNIIWSIAILDSNQHTDDPTAPKFVLVQWEGLSVEETTWEDFTDLTKSYPNLLLRNKVSFQPGRDDIYDIESIDESMESFTNKDLLSHEKDDQNNKKPWWSLILTKDKETPFLFFFSNVRIMYFRSFSQFVFRVAKI